MRIGFSTLFFLIVILFAPLGGVLAQDVPPVQELHGSLAPSQVDVFLVEGLKKGQTLDAFMENTSGNLDPILSILPANENFSATLDSFQKAMAALIASSSQPLLDLPALRDQYSLAWDDDSGPGYSAALKFTAPYDGDFFLIVSSSLSAGGRSTAGDYRLLLSLDNPEVLGGTAESTEAVIAVQNQSILETQLIQVLSGNLNQNKPALSV